MSFEKEIEKTILDGLAKAIKKDAPELVKSTLKTNKDNPLVDNSTKRFGFSKLTDSNMRP